MTKTPTVLTIAGSDPYGGAGIQVDAKTIHALGGYAFSVPTALTAQNSLGVSDVFPTDSKVLRQQLQVLLDDVEVDAVKIGMLANRNNVEVVAEMIERYALKHIVLDTVLVSSSGYPLLADGAMDCFRERLLPMADIITPNLPEVNRLLQVTETPFVGREQEMPMIAEKLFGLDVKAAVIKGGHSGDPDWSSDYLLQPTQVPRCFSAPRLNTTHTHGTGCVLSSAIAIGLAQGEELSKSVDIAKVFLTHAMEQSDSLNFHYRQNHKNRREPIL